MKHKRVIGILGLVLGLLLAGLPQVAANGENWHIPPENIIDDPWGVAWNPYTGPFEPYGSIFWAILMGSLCIVLYIKTESVIAPLVVIFLMGMLAAPLAGPFAGYFILASGAALGVLIFYLIVKRR